MYGVTKRMTNDTKTSVRSKTQPAEMAVHES